MSENDTYLCNGYLFVAIIGGICYFYVIVYKTINVIKGLFMNIFGGGSGSGSKRVRCDGSDSELEAVKARDVFSGLIKDGHQSENFGTQVGEVVDASYEFDIEISNEEHMRDTLNFLIEIIASKDIEENGKWESINNAYCQLSVSKERRKAEVLRNYFRKLDTTFKRKDGTIYSKVISADKAQEIIEELIDVYPWDVPIKFETKSEPSKNAASEKRNSEIDELKGSVSDLINVIAQINDRLDKIK